MKFGIAFLKSLKLDMLRSLLSRLFHSIIVKGEIQLFKKKLSLASSCGILQRLLGDLLGIKVRKVTHFVIIRSYVKQTKIPVPATKLEEAPNLIFFSYFS